MLERVTVEFLVFVAIITSIASAAAASEETNSWFGPEFIVLQKVYDDCQDKNDFTGCLKGKALVALTKAVDQDSIVIVDGVSLEKQNSSSVAETPSITTQRAMNELNGIDKELMQKLDKFLRSHVVKLDMSEGREKGKKEHKKFHEYAVAAFLAAMGIAAPLGLKALAVIAGKALIISKVALTIAGIIALKKIYTNDHHEETSFHVQSAGEHNRRVALNSNSNNNNKQMVMPSNMDPYRYYYDYNQVQAN